jgi:hypothetical protein
MQKMFIRSTVITVSMLLFWLGLNQILNGSIWSDMTLSKSALTGEYCEFNNPDRFFHQSMNTYSNLVYFFLGILICQIAWEDCKSRNFQNRLANFPALSALMGVCFIYLSFGSAFFHASLTWVSQRVDMNCTYSITLTLASIGLYNVLHKINFSEQAKKVWIIIMVTIILTFYQVHLLISSGILVPILIFLMLITIGVNYFQFPRQRYLFLGILSLVLIIIAVKIRTMDVQKINCNPHSLYQGHSVWHLLAGLSSFCNYAFFRFWKK